MRNWISRTVLSWSFLAGALFGVVMATSIFAAEKNVGPNRVVDAMIAGVLLSVFTCVAIRVAFGKPTLFWFLVLFIIFMTGLVISGYLTWNGVLRTWESDQLVLKIGFLFTVWFFHLTLPINFAKSQLKRLDEALDNS